MWIIQLLLGVALMLGGIWAIVYFTIIRQYTGKKDRSFNAYDARELLESARVRQYQAKQGKWNWKDELVLKNIERKIKVCCRKGESKLIISDSTSPKVLAKLQSNGYRVSREGAPIDFKIFIVVEW